MAWADARRRGRAVVRSFFKVNGFYTARRDDQKVRIGTIGHLRRMYRSPRDAPILGHGGTIGRVAPRSRG